jgi:hypothetical protein
MQVLVGKISMQSHLDEFAGAVRTLAEQEDVDADRIFAVADSEGTLHALNYQIADATIPWPGSCSSAHPDAPSASSPVHSSRPTSIPCQPAMP